MFDCDWLPSRVGIKIGTACIKIGSRKPTQCIEIGIACNKIWSREPKTESMY